MGISGSVVVVAVMIVFVARRSPIGTVRTRTILAWSSITVNYSQEVGSDRRWGLSGCFGLCFTKIWFGLFVTLLVF
jgi:hypothetical protein